MDNEALKTLVGQGLSAMRAGGDVAARATSDIRQDSTNPDLQQMLDRGTEQSKQWQQRIEQALEQAGGGDQNDNKVLEAHFEVSKPIRQQAPDPVSRDLGIIAAGQLALHYWIASFGTMKAYTAQLGMTEASQAMDQCSDEAGEADKELTQLARQVMRA